MVCVPVFGFMLLCACVCQVTWNAEFSHFCYFTLARRPYPRALFPAVLSLFLLLWQKQHPLGLFPPGPFIASMDHWWDAEMQSTVGAGSKAMAHNGKSLPTFDLKLKDVEGDVLISGPELRRFVFISPLTSFCFDYAWKHFQFVWNIILLIPISLLCCSIIELQSIT